MQAPARRAVPAAVPQREPAISREAAEPSRNAISSSVSALPAATTIVQAPQIARAPIASYGDIFQPLPGFSISNYNQGAIGMGIAMRGFTEGEHGRDIAFFIDGMPINEVSAIHTPNYVDLNVLIPETVARVEVIRGPFSVEAGDSNLGGTVNITTKRSEPVATANLSGGSFGTVRGLATYSSVGGTVEPYIAAEGYTTQGYRDNSFIDRYNSFNKFTIPFADGSVLSMRGQFYGTTYGAASYISRDAVKSGALSDKAAVNGTDGGSKYQQNLVANYQSGAPDQELNSTLYFNHDVFDRYADFGGGQRIQHDERETVGGRVRKLWTGQIADGIPAQLLIGGNWRSDFITTWQGPTTARVETGPRVIDAGVDQHNVAGFAQLQVKPTPWLKLTGGARYDRFFYDINNRIDPANSPDVSTGVFSPKAGLAITPTHWLEFFTNYGEGFRSPNAALELLSNPTLRPQKIKSVEGGVALRFDRFNFLAGIWSSDIANEAYQAAPGLPLQNLGRSKREGFDLEARYAILKSTDGQLSLFANFTQTRARLENGVPSSLYVPNVPTSVLNVGVDADMATRNGQRVFGSAYVTYVGKKYLTEDGLLTTSAYARVSAKVGYAWPSGWSAFTQATWYPGDRLSEIAINFGPGVGATSADIFTSPVAKLTVLAGLSYRFPPSNVGIFK
ncbi:outer membrane receptor protein involved in Fe transport [Variibacter gotjawalensis]|nr:outer membrane receptor protein involved in Fe transport [Variibacter gotjawalensis]